MLLSRNKTFEFRDLQVVVLYFGSRKNKTLFKSVYNLQHGFQNKRSTESKLISFTQDVLKNLNKSGKHTDINIMDKGI